MEDWRQVVGHEGLYEVSSQGRVRSLKRGVFLAPITIDDRPYIGLSRDGISKKHLLHSIVAAAFLGPRPDRHDVAHRNGEHLDCRVENLEYVTVQETIRRTLSRSGGPKVNLTKRVKTLTGLRYCPIAVSANGRIKPDVVLVNGTEERHPEGAYYLEWRDGSRRIRISVGKHAADAAARKQRKEAELNAVNKGVSVISEEQQNARRTLAAAIADYLDDVKLSKKPKTYAAYRVATEYFVNSCHKLYLDEIERKDMLRFAAYLRDEEDQSPRSTYNKFENLMSFLKWAGIRGIVGKNDWPRYTEEIPKVYEDPELKKLFGACNDEELMWYQFFLMTGEREQEVMHTCWRDVNLAAGVLSMSHKPEYNWTPKAYKEREIPIPARLVKRLKVWKKKCKKDCPLLFPTSGSRPKLDFLDCLKVVAERAKLDPDDFWLHKFRSTFATRCLQAGVDLRTVQSWIGHDDLESTMRYLRPARNERVRSKVDAIFA